jgi:hypothetical protein
MRSLLLILVFTLVAFVSWGMCGPTLHVGQVHLGGTLQPSSLRAFLCVGLAYFLIAVVVPMAALRFRGEQGRWTFRGAFWSLAAGAVGAVGTLGIILAFRFRGSPVYVMPLVFGLAPVVQTFVKMWMARTFRQANAVFSAGVIVVAVGAAGLLCFRPSITNIKIDGTKEGPITVAFTQLEHGTPHTDTWEAKDYDELRDKKELEQAYRLYLKAQPLKWQQKMVLIPLSILLAAIGWGSCGAILDKGQMLMDGSRLRPFLCVGLAYFIIAICVPLSMLSTVAEPGSWTTLGAIWAFLGGAAGAIGALAIILALNSGGKPFYVMPLVFGGAPAVNTLIEMLTEGSWQVIGSPFFASLLLVIAGTGTLLVFAPRGRREGPPEPGPQPPSAEDTTVAAPSEAGTGDPPTAVKPVSPPQPGTGDPEVGEDTSILEETWDQGWRQE